MEEDLYLTTLIVVGGLFTTEIVFRFIMDPFPNNKQNNVKFSKRKRNNK